MYIKQGAQDMKNKLTIAMVQKALRKNIDFVDTMLKSEQKDNPQIVKMVTEAVGRIDAYQAVLDAMRGDTVAINFT